MIRDQFFQQADPPSHNLLAAHHGITVTPLAKPLPHYPCSPSGTDSGPAWSRQGSAVGAGSDLPDPVAGEPGGVLVHQHRSAEAGGGVSRQ